MIALLHTRCFVLFALTTALPGGLQALDWEASAEFHYGFKRETGPGYGLRLAATHQTGFGLTAVAANFNEGAYHFDQFSRFAIVDRDFPISTTVLGLGAHYALRLERWQLRLELVALRAEQAFDTLELLPTDGTRRVEVEDAYWIAAPGLAVNREFGSFVLSARLSYLPLRDFITGLPAPRDNLVEVSRETVVASVGISYRF